MQDARWEMERKPGTVCGEGRPDLQTEVRPGLGSYGYLHVSNLTHHTPYSKFQSLLQTSSIIEKTSDPLVHILYCPSLLSGIQGLAIHHDLNG
jgi:hypothetical protein